MISLPKTEAGIRQVPVMRPVIDAFIEEYKWAESKHFISETIVRLVDKQPPHTRDFSRELGGSSCNSPPHMV